MENLNPINMKEIPLRIEGINDNIYAGFGPRLASLLLDSIILGPVIFAILYFNSSGLYMYYYTLVPNLIINLWYYVYLPKRYGATPGKLIMGMQIIRLDGEKIGWREAFLRHLVMFILAISGAALTIYGMSKTDEATFESLSWLQQSQHLMSFSPILLVIYTWLSNGWFWSELIVLLTNPRKRALHDYIAGTVIVKKMYVSRIQEEMNADKGL